ncbi:hypothetical protein ABZ863_13900 [Saccharomonospora sp. NPDC046836]|uniref:hypothetical protein n=1 Tax=Saccharomonospora sp. NPDC046836 TaxID=3156921 RepID=UPI00340F262A
MYHQPHFSARPIPVLVPIGLSVLFVPLGIFAAATSKGEGLAAIRALGAMIVGLPLRPSYVDLP